MAIIKATLLLLAAALGAHGQSVDSNNGTIPTGAHCVRGATYCGYILLEHQDYSTDQVVKAYCQGRDKCDSKGVPKDKDAWKYALFVCLPDEKGHRHKVHRRHGNFDCTESVDTKIMPLVYCKPPHGASGVSEDEVCLNPKENRIGRCWEPGNLE